MSSTIKNVSDLKAELVRLKMIELQQADDLIKRVNTPSALFKTVVSAFPKSKASKSEGKSDILDQDLFGLLSRILLPLVLNGTIFRNSNILVKTLVGLISQKASHYISEDAVIKVVDKLRHFLDKRNKKTDYGIPPLSETY